MGQDACIFIEDTGLTDEVLAAIEERLPEFGETEPEGSKLHRGDGMILLHTWQRFYGEDYRRGNWPHIRTLIGALADASGSPVYYASDLLAMVDEDYLVTPERLAELDATWERHARRPRFVEGHDAMRVVGERPEGVPVGHRTSFTCRTIPLMVCFCAVGARRLSPAAGHPDGSPKMHSTSEYRWGTGANLKEALKNARASHYKAKKVNIEVLVLSSKPEEWGVNGLGQFMWGDVDRHRLIEQYLVVDGVREDVETNDPLVGYP